MNVRYVCRNKECPAAKEGIIYAYGWLFVRNLVTGDGKVATCPECGGKLGVAATVNQGVKGSTHLKRVYRRRVAKTYRTEPKLGRRKTARKKAALRKYVGSKS